MSFSRNRARAVSALGVLTAGAALAFSALSVPAQAATAAATTAPQYNLTITRSPGLGQQTSFSGINANGEIFGSAVESGSPSEEGFLLKAGSTTLQFLGSPGDPGNTKSVATPDGLNVADDILQTPLFISSPVALPAGV